MKFRIKVRNARTPEGWWEEYAKDEVTDPEEWGRDLVQQYNDSLREGEIPREFIAAEVLNAAAGSEEHAWEKQNLSTIFDGRNIYDVLKCKRCGATAKRYGLTRITLDAKFRRSKKYIQGCPGGKS